MSYFLAKGCFRRLKGSAVTSKFFSGVTPPYSQFPYIPSTCFHSYSRGRKYRGVWGCDTAPTDKTRQFAEQLNPFAGHKLSLTVANSAYRCCHGACEAPGKIAKFNFGKQKSTTSVVPFLSGGLCEL